MNMDLNEAVRQLLDAWANTIPSSEVGDIWDELVEVKKAYFEQEEAEEEA